MCVEVINGMADTIAELENKIDFICEQLAQDFDEPCNFSPMDEIMLSIGRCGEDCGDVPKSECWKRYFEVMQRRAESEEYKTASEMRDYCEKYEPTYNSEDGSM